MPNWVYNTLTVSGTPADIKAFADKAKQQYETRWLSESWIRNEDGTSTRVEEKDRKVIVSMSKEVELSFWNFIAPPTEKLDLYFGEANGTEDKEWNWYAWNNANWGTKWDANDVSMSPEYDEINDTTGSIVYYFSTAWSVPEPVLSAMINQHTELHFHLRGVEEQGWGVEFSGSDGSYGIDREWDIPSSHKEWVDTDQEGSCKCSYEDEEDNFYSDCPRDETDFIVVVQKSYRVSASSAENAYELAIEQEGNANEKIKQLDETTAWVIDDQGVRQYPTLNSEVPKLE